MAFPRRTLEGISELLNSINTKIQNALLPSGAIVWFKRQTAPTGWAICDGTNGTPNLIGRYPLGATSDIGSTVEAGLPNIAGMAGLEAEVQTADGCFTRNRTADDGGFHGGARQPDGLGFDASKGTVDTNGEYMAQEDSPYGKSNTVTPPSVKLLPCMKL